MNSSETNKTRENPSWRAYLVAAALQLQRRTDVTLLLQTGDDSLGPDRPGLRL